MIRPLRRRHRAIVSTLFAILLLAGLVAIVYRAPSNRTATLPDALRADAVKAP